jgi:hypothetical protein
LTQGRRELRGWRRKAFFIDAARHDICFEDNPQLRERLFMAPCVVGRETKLRDNTISRRDMEEKAMCRKFSEVASLRISAALRLCVKGNAGE